MRFIQLSRSDCIVFLRCNIAPIYLASAVQVQLKIKCSIIFSTEIQLLLARNVFTVTANIIFKVTAFS